MDRSTRNFNSLAANLVGSFASNAEKDSSSIPVKAYQFLTLCVRINTTFGGHIYFDHSADGITWFSQDKGQTMQGSSQTEFVYQVRLGEYIKVRIKATLSAGNVEACQIVCKT